ncbi:nucleotidyltransferase family protein [Cypionkella sp.]|uniref:nucleotidyltransferase family protein n=1 Tax=Cypionkella sp. TaxID=2811411 RepID=UPI00271BC2EF|nr:nucleotidyltransferase family protein [Cypionkella sp.]MDO8982380.1 nucleotidyltransferase family protein [Cypionkella sp.]MDP1577085.1 nucleotidyltransferase family protein [Cypionkella sp.]MDP2050630.1 nucleotidyltransferase family protein [Cypionkella sp.]
MTSPNPRLAALSVGTAASIHEAMAAIDRGARQIALVTDADDRLVGTVTDGDIRRALLRGVALDAPVTEVMHIEFAAARVDSGPSAARQMMLARKLHQLPIIDAEGRLVDLLHVDDLTGLTRRETRVILMAGGLGTRLRPLTETVPKPMLPIGGRPILEKIIGTFVDQGFYRFTIALNYKGEMIRDHFGDGAAFGAEIEYVHETQRMGTAGALSLLPVRPDAPCIVMNGDLLTSLQFDTVLRFHAETGAMATMCAREYSVQVPYGVVEVVDETRLRGIVEKPTYTHFVNAGIYVLSPEALDNVVPGTWLDMPTLFERVIAQGLTASVFPLQEYWIDIGRMEDLERARVDFETGGEP